MGYPNQADETESEPPVLGPVRHLANRPRLSLPVKFRVSYQFHGGIRGRHGDRAIEGSTLLPDFDQIVGVFVIDEGELPRARLQIVTLGRSDDDRVAVLDGLREGQHVVVEGQFALADGDPLEVGDAVVLVGADRLKDGDLVEIAQG